MKKLLFIILMASISLAALTPEDVGCTLAGDYYKCQEPAIINNVEMKMDSDIKCFSSNTTASCTNNCADLIDYGCFSVAKLLQPLDIQDCYSYVGNNSMPSKANTCNTVLFNANEPNTIFINPYIIDYSQCSKEVKNETYIITCPTEGKTILINGSTNSDYTSLIIIEMSTSATINDIFMNNIVYIAMGAVILLLALWVFMPRKAKKVKK